MNEVDMSEKAVLRRLRQVDQLRELSLSLMKAKKAHDEKLRKEKVEDHPSPESIKKITKEPTS